MRALLVMNAPVFGGGHNQIAVLRPPLERRGWESLAVVPDERGNARSRLEAEGVEVITLSLHRLRATPDPRVQARFLAGLRPEVQALRRLVREREIDLVQAHGVIQLHAAVAGHLEGAAVVWELYDTRAPMPLRRAAMPLVTRTADVITTWGEELAKVHPGVESLGHRHVTVFPPVDASKFKPDPAQRARAREWLGVPEDIPVVGSVGNLNPSKGHEHLIEAAALVRRSHPDTRFRIVGAPGKAHATYAARLRERVGQLQLDREDALTFVGSVSRVADLVPAFDVLALTSVTRSEGMPTVILEAMACGLPVVATDVAAVKELVEDGTTGLLVEAGDHEAIAAALGRLIEDGPFRSAMGRTARERALARYELERCADVRVHAYELALEHRRNRRGGARRPT